MGRVFLTAPSFHRLLHFACCKMKYGLLTAEWSFKLIKSHFHSEGTVMCLKHQLTNYSQFCKIFCPLQTAIAKTGPGAKAGCPECPFKASRHRPAMAHGNWLLKRQLCGN